jgi:ABC-type nickel/cobalt efflux system permease component RcnA
MSRAIPQQATDGLNLRDIHMPPAPSWWPLAPGWWMLFAFVCVALLVAWLLYRRVRKQRSERQRILAEIGQVSARHPHDDTAYATAMHQLLRRVARRYADGAHVAQGEPWRQVLALIPVDAPTVDALMMLDTRMYQPHADFDRSHVEAAAQRWLDAAWRHIHASGVRHA